MSRILATSLAVLALASASTAQAATDAKPCLTRNEVRGMMAYFAPTAIRRLGQTCTPFLSAGGYLRKNLPSIEARYAAGQDSAWPAARGAILKFMGNETKGQFDVSKLSDSALRPMADEIIAQKLVLKMDQGKCMDAEDIIQAVAPINPDIMLDVISTVIGVVARKDGKLPVCGRAG